MDTKHCWRRYHFNVNMFITFILLLIHQSTTINAHSANNHHHSQTQPHFSSNLDGATSIRRDIASISVTEVNRSRNLRQTNDESLKYTEIRPAHSHHYYHGEFDNSIERNNTDNRKPAFYACKDYAPKVKEEQPYQTFVIKVEAEDPDEYDTITYSFEKSVNERAKFKINEKTGDIITSYTFDRDEPIREKEVSIIQKTKILLFILLQRKNNFRFVQ